MTIADDGLGFDIDSSRTGRGVNDSITGRMKQVGRSAGLSLR
ncbi:hypothetical protein [Mycobacterium sp. MS1601]|nr:hypothetical protein [Mycobacterium sp. MS1601]